MKKLNNGKVRKRIKNNIMGKMKNGKTGKMEKKF